jgi:hypothetical protein
MPERSGDGSLASSFPHAALDDGTWDIVRAHITHRLNKSIDSLRSGHRPFSNLPNNLDFFVPKIRREWFFVSWKPNEVETERSERSVDGILNEL